MKVRSDGFDEHQKHMKGMMSEVMDMDSIPVDLYGKQVLKKKEGDNVQMIAEDVREFYDLAGKAGLSSE